MNLNGRFRGRLIVILLTGACSQIAAATPSLLFKDVSSQPYFPHSPYVISLSANSTWANPGNAQTTYLQPDIEKTYTANRQIARIEELEIFLGLQRALSSRIDAQFGLAAMTTNTAKLSGNIWDDADPLFNNYNYAYHVYHQHIALKGKLLTSEGRFKPYISGSVGAGFNHAFHFTNTPLFYEAVTLPNFTSNTTTALTYTLGIGVEMQITKQWQAGVGYEFADWGKVQLSKAPGQTLGDGLSMNHLYTQGISLNLTYVT